MADRFDSKSLIPFKTRRFGYELPGKEKDASEQIIDQFDPELQPEEQRYVHHFLAYAETLLKNTDNGVPKANPAPVEQKDETSTPGADAADMPGLGQDVNDDAA